MKYSEDSSFLNDILEAEGDEIDEDQLGEKLSEKKDDVAIQELMGQKEEEEAAKEAESKDAKAPAKRSAKAPKAASDEAEAEAPAPAPAPTKRSSTASAPWGDVTKDEADVKVGGDDWASSSDDD